jgi:hypothetical protein
LKGMAHGFYFADFCGDHVVIDLLKDGNKHHARIEAKDIVWYNNSLTSPPT